MSVPSVKDLCLLVVDVTGADGQVLEVITNETESHRPALAPNKSEDFDRICFLLLSLIRTLALTCCLV